VCKASHYNSYDVAGPAVVLSVGRSGSGLIRPLLQCIGLSTETDKCDGDVELAFVTSEKATECLKKGRYYVVKAHPEGYEDSIESAISMIQSSAASIGNRTLVQHERAKIIAMVRDPLEVIFSWMESRLTFKTLEKMKNYELRIYREEFRSISKTPEGHESIVNTMRSIGIGHVRDWDIMRRVILDTSSYDTLMITGDELRDPLIQPSLLAEISRHAGIEPDHEAILNGIHKMETVYSSKVDAANEDIMKCDEFYSEVSIEGMPYICHLIDEVPAIMKSIVEQGFMKRLAMFASICPGFDEKWLEETDVVFEGLVAQK